MDKKLRDRDRKIYGAAFFSDNLAGQIRNEFRDLFALGIPLDKIENLMTSFFESAEGNDYARAVAYVALALTEHNAGVLSDRLKSMAEQIFSTDILLKPWKDACLVPKEEQSEFWDILADDYENFVPSFFYNGYDYSKPAGEPIDHSENEIKIISELLGVDLGDKNLRKQRKEYIDSKFSEDLKYIFALDKSCDKKLKLREEAINKAWQTLSSPLPKQKKYPQPELRYCQDDFVPGDVVICKIPDGKYCDKWFAFQVFKKTLQAHFMCTDIGDWYKNFVAIYDYLEKDKPDLAVLKARGYKNLKRVKNEGKFYDNYIKELVYNKNSLNIVANVVHDEAYMISEQNKEASLVSRMNGGFRDIDLSAYDKIADLIVSPEFSDFDVTGEEESILSPPKREASPYPSDEMNEDDFVSIEDEGFPLIMDKNDTHNSEKLDKLKVDEFFIKQIEVNGQNKFALGYIKPPLFEYIIEKYGSKIKCLQLYMCKFIENLDILGKLDNLIYVEINCNYRSSRLWDMSGNTRLTGLRIFGMTRLESLADIATAPSLKYLSLGENLNSLPSLQSLRGSRLEVLYNSSYPHVNGLEDYEYMTNLKRLWFGTAAYSTEEVARLAARLPHVEGSHLKAYVDYGDDQVMITGIRKPCLNKQKDREKIKKYEDAFNALVSKYRNEIRFR